jgi:hypothetical protein
MLKIALGSLFRVTVDAPAAKTLLLRRHPRFLEVSFTIRQISIKISNISV